MLPLGRLAPQAHMKWTKKHNQTLKMIEKLCGFPTKGKIFPLFGHDLFLLIEISD